MYYQLSSEMIKEHDVFRIGVKSDVHAYFKYCSP